MMRYTKTFLLTLCYLYLVGCGENIDKHTQLNELKIEALALNQQIVDLENELGVDKATIDASSILVTTIEINPTKFSHMIELRGTVQSKKNVMLSSETMGKITQIRVKEGDRIKKGGVILILDASVLKNTIFEVEHQLELVTTLFVRQKNLWDRQIGTEVQFLQARNNKVALEKKLETLNSQLDQYIVKAPFESIVDAIPVKEGEVAQPGLPLVRLISPDERYIDIDVSEVFLGTISVGDLVSIRVPNIDEMIPAKVSAIGNIIKSDNRTFSLKINISKKYNKELKPNQTVSVMMTDYENNDAMVVPSKLILNDNTGKYIFGIGRSEEGSDIAEKIRVTTGMTYGGATEIMSGLNKNDILILDGYYEVDEGSIIIVAE